MIVGTEAVLMEKNIKKISVNSYFIERNPEYVTKACLCNKV